MITAEASHLFGGMSCLQQADCIVVPEVSQAQMVHVKRPQEVPGQIKQIGNREWTLFLSGVYDIGIREFDPL